MRIAFVIPYYGKLPAYFDMWLLSVEKNPTIDFLLFTDLVENRKLPPNVILYNWSFEQLQHYIQGKFDFTITLDCPYKLCDFRPAYGYIFAEYLQVYDYWGHCDIDLMFGDLITLLQEKLGRYDVIGKYGHMTLYRNLETINNIFKKKGDIYDYKEVYSNPENYAFDEGAGVKRIVKNENLKYLELIEDMADMNTYCMKMAHSHYNSCKQIFIWENGKVWQAYKKNGAIYYKEYLYIHFQKRAYESCQMGTSGAYILEKGIQPRNDNAEDEKIMKKECKWSNPCIWKIKQMIWCVQKWIALQKEPPKQKSILQKKRRYQ